MEIDSVTCIVHMKCVEYVHTVQIVYNVEEINELPRSVWLATFALS
jgi:hypothetical protein